MVEKNQIIEDIIFKKLIQSPVEFYTTANGVKNIIKVGIIKNFNIKIPFIFFILEHKNKMREYPLPQPFTCEWKDGRMVLSYRIQDCTTNKKLIDRMMAMGCDSDSKIFNQLLYIAPIHE